MPDSLAGSAVFAAGTALNRAAVGGGNPSWKGAQTRPGGDSRSRPRLVQREGSAKATAARRWAVDPPPTTGDGRARQQI